METYKVVVFLSEGPEVEVVVRDYSEVQPCPHCGQKQFLALPELGAVAQADGEALGKMLQGRGSAAFLTGLIRALGV